MYFSKELMIVPVVRISVGTVLQVDEQVSAGYCVVVGLGIDNCSGLPIIDYATPYVFLPMIGTNSLFGSHIVRLADQWHIGELLQRRRNGIYNSGLSLKRSMLDDLWDQTSRRLIREYLKPPIYLVCPNLY